MSKIYFKDPAPETDLALERAPSLKNTIPYLVRDEIQQSTELPQGVSELSSRLEEDQNSGTSAAGMTDISDVEAPDDVMTDKEDVAPLGVVREIRRAILAAGIEDLDEAEYSYAEQELINAIRQYNSTVFQVLEEMLWVEKSREETLSEALRLLGYISIEDQRVSERRLVLLKRALRSTSYWIRDGASLALGALEDPDAIQALRSAIQNESVDPVRSSMERILAWLEEKE